MENNNNSQKGFALAMVLFLIVGIAAIITGVFLNASRHQRDAGRGINSVNAHWVAESLLDAGVAELNRFVSSESRMPEANEMGGIRAKVLAHFSANPVFVGFNISSFDMTQLPDDPADPSVNNPAFNRYKIQTHVQHAYTKAEAALTQDVQLGKGNIFDYAAFYEHDLEITPGPSAEYQGPIFTNGNVFLMSGINETLTLNAPDLIAGNPPPANVDYVLKSAGNIYFYYKPVIARNYMSDVNPQYCRGVSDAYLYPAGKTTASGLCNGTGYEIYFKDYLDADGLNPALENKPRPMVYYFKNEIYDLDETTGLSDGWAKHPIYIKKRSGSQVQLKFPKVTYERLYGGWSFLEPGLVTSHYDASLYGDPSGGALSISPAYEPENGSSLGTYRQAMRDLGSSQHFPDGQNLIAYDPPVNPGWQDFKNSNLRGVVADKQDGVQPIILPIGDLPLNTSRHVLIEPADAADSTSVQKNKLMGKANVLILCADADCVTSKLVIRNGGGGTEVVPPAGVFNDNTCITDNRLGGEISPNSSYNGLMKGYFRAVSLDIQALNNFVSQPTYGIDKPVIYIETKSFAANLRASHPLGQYWDDHRETLRSTNPAKKYDSCTGLAGPVRAVVLSNTAKLPAKGMTVVTNGRLWLRAHEPDSAGDEHHYNVYNKSGDRCYAPGELGFGSAPGNQQWPKCDLPPAAIVSDSMGILVDKDSDDGKVNDDYVLNSAVVTGYLESTLEPRFPNCHANAAGEIPTGTADLCGGHYWNNGGDPTPGTQLTAFPHSTGNGRYSPDMCPAGLQSNGKPVIWAPDPNVVDKPTKDPLFQHNYCRFYRNPNDGAYYYRRIAAIKMFFDAIQDEAATYLQTKAYAGTSFLPDLDCKYYPTPAFDAAHPTDPRVTAFFNRIQSLLNPGGSNPDPDPDVQALVVDLKAYYDNFYIANFPVQNIQWGPGDISPGIMTYLVKTNAGTPVLDQMFVDNLTDDERNMIPHKLFPGAPPAQQIQVYERRFGPEDTFPVWLKVDTGNVAAANSLPNLFNNRATNAFQMRDFFWWEFAVDFGIIPDWPIPLKSDGTCLDSSNHVIRGWECVSPRRKGLRPRAVPDFAGTVHSTLVWDNLEGVMMDHNSGRGIKGYLLAAPTQGTGNCTQVWVPGTETIPGHVELIPPGCIQFGAWSGTFVEMPIRHSYLLGVGFLNRCPTEAHPCYDDEYWHASSRKPYIQYWDPSYQLNMGERSTPYIVRYSGGMENLINFDANWSYRTGENPDHSPIMHESHLYFSGTLTAPWSSSELIGTDGPAYYRTDYYTPPKRIFDYDESLSTDPPPAAPNTFMLKRLTRTTDQGSA